jgi:hypothetical protein
MTFAEKIIVALVVALAVTVLGCLFHGMISL